MNSSFFFFYIICFLTDFLLHILGDIFRFLFQALWELVFYNHDFNISEFFFSSFLIVFFYMTICPGFLATVFSTLGILNRRSLKVLLSELVLFPPRSIFSV